MEDCVLAPNPSCHHHVCNGCDCGWIFASHGNGTWLVSRICMIVLAFAITSSWLVVGIPVIMKIMNGRNKSHINHGHIHSLQRLSEWFPLWQVHDRCGISYPSLCHYEQRFSCHAHLDKLLLLLLKNFLQQAVPRFCWQHPFLGQPPYILFFQQA